MEGAAEFFIGPICLAPGLADILRRGGERIRHKNRRNTWPLIDNFCLKKGRKKFFGLATSASSDKVYILNKRNTPPTQIFSKWHPSVDHFATSSKALSHKGTKLWHFKDFEMK